MTARSDRGPTDSGVVVYPRLPVPGKRDSDPRFGRNDNDVGGLSTKRIAIAAVALFAIGALIGFWLRPAVTTDPRIGELEAQLGSAQAASDSATQRAQLLDRKVNETTAALAARDKQVTELQSTVTAHAEKSAERGKQAGALRDKLKGALDKSLNITPEIAGDAVVIALPSQLLFKVNDDVLTDRGKQVLDKLALAVKDQRDRQLTVIGHTDDTPPPPPAKPATPPPAPPKKGKPAPAAAVLPPPRPATNWELAASRALAVVHYWQDVAKVDPARIAMQSFGQYRPASKTNKALNRRIEIVIAPKPMN